MELTSDAEGGEMLGSAENSRPENLKINQIPDRVRYVSISDEEMIEAEAKLTGMINRINKSEFGERLLVFPGLMKTINNAIDTSGVHGKEVKVVLNFQGQNKTYYGGLFDSNEGKRKIWNALVDLINKTPIRIRSLNTEELSLWWMYIPFDITEPIFTVNDRFIVGMNSNYEITVVDDISRYTSSGMIIENTRSLKIQMEEIKLLNTDKELRENYSVEQFSEMVKKIDNAVLARIKNISMDMELVLFVEIGTSNGPIIKIIGATEKSNLDFEKLENDITSLNFRTKTKKICFELHYKKNGT